MKIKQFNEMKAYLLKPNRLFSSNNSRENFKFGTGPKTIKKIQELLDEGKNIDQVAKFFKVSRSSIKRAMSGAGIKIRDQEAMAEELTDVYNKLKTKLGRDPSYAEMIRESGRDKKTITRNIGDFTFSEGRKVEGAGKKGLEASKEYFKTRKVDKPTYSKIDGKVSLKWPSPEVEQDYIKDLETIYSRPKAPNTNDMLSEKYKIPKAEVERINSVLIRDRNLKYPEADSTGVYKTRRGRLVKTVGPKLVNVKGTPEMQFHHIKQIGGEVPLTAKDVAFISKEMNSKLSPYNKKLNNIADEISDTITASFKAMETKNEGEALNLLKKVDTLNKEAENLVSEAVEKLPKKYKPYIGFNKFYPVTDEYGFPLDDKVTVEPIGGGLQKGEFEKPLTQYTEREIIDFKIKQEKDLAKKIASIKNIPVTEVQEDVSKVTKLLNETAGKLNSGTDPVFLAKYLKAQGEDIAAFGKKYGGDALNKIIKGTTALDLPIFQVAFASMQDWEEDSPLWVTLPAAFTDYTAKTFNLYEKTGGKAKEFGKFLASSLLPRFMRSPVFKAVSKFGKGASFLAPAIEIGFGVKKDLRQRGMLPEIARKFNIPIEEAKKGYTNYLRSTVPQDAMGYLDIDMDEGTAYVPESPGLEGLIRGFKEIGAFLGFNESPYKDPNAKQPIEVETPKVDNRDFLFGGGVASLFKKAAQVSEALRRVKNSTFEMWNNVRMFGEQKGVAKNLESFTNIPDKNRKIASIEDIKALKESVPEKYHQDLNIMMRSIEQNNFETAWKEYKKFELDLEPTLKFENIPQEYFPMLDPLNDAFVIEGPRNSFKRGRYQIKTSMELDKTTGQPTGKYQTEKYDTFDPETRTFRDEPVLVGASTEKGKKGFN